MEKDPGQIPLGLQRLGDNVEVLSNSNFKTKKLAVSSFSSYSNKLVRRIFRIIFVTRRSRNLDVIHLQNLDNWRELSLAKWASIFNPRIITYVKMDNCIHCGRYLWEKRLKDSPVGLKERVLRWMYLNVWLKGTFLFSVEDEDTMKYLRQKYPEYFKKNIFFMPNGYLNDVLTSCDSFEKEKIVVFAGTLNEHKNALTVLSAFSNLAKKYSDWQFYICGQTESVDFSMTWKNMLESLIISNNLLITGYLSKIDLYNLLQQSKVFVLPSKYDTFANVYAEALSFNNLIITGKNNSVSTLLKRHSLGSILEMSEELEVVLETYLRDEQLLNLTLNHVKNFDFDLSWNSLTYQLRIKLLECLES